MHALAANVTSDSLSSISLWGERSARLLGVLVILAIFFFQRGPNWKHGLEILVLLILGVWYVPAIVPPKVSTVIAGVNTGGAAGATGISWGMLALLVGLVALVVFAFR